MTHIDRKRQVDAIAWIWGFVVVELHAQFIAIDINPAIQKISQINEALEELPMLSST
jgi:hypothetical protein